MEEMEGKEVVKGNHVVPKGVAVEELDGGKKKLSNECPADLQELLVSKGLMDVYDKLVKAIVDESHTRNFFGKWQDAEFVSVIDLFRDDFAEKGVSVALCKRQSSGSGTLRWLEFIDRDSLPTYVPQFDVSNFSGQVIKTCYTTLNFPNGVAVEELKEWGKKRTRLREKIPIHVEKLLEKRDLLTEYEAFVEDCANNGCGSNSKLWNLDQLLEIFERHRPNFEAKGISIFLSHKTEYISHGQYGGHNEYFRWIEFVDRELQPNYFPQREAQDGKEKCVIS